MKAFFIGVFCLSVIGVGVACFMRRYTVRIVTPRWRDRRDWFRSSNARRSAAASRRAFFPPNYVR